MIFEIIEIIQVFIIFQCVLFSVYLFTSNSRKSLSNIVLIVLLVVLGSQMTLLTLIGSDFKLAYSLSISLRFLFGPIQYFYVRSITKKEFKLNLASLTHLLPFITMLFLQSLHVSMSRIVILIMINLSVISYQIASYRIIYSYQAVLKEIQSSYSKISLNWLKQLVSLFS